MKLRLNWNFDKPYYSPSDYAKINLWLENYESRHIYVSQIQVEFEFGVYELPQIIYGAIAPSSTGFLGIVSIELPPNRVGAQRFRLKYGIHELVSENWIQRPTHSTRYYIINIFSTPNYRVFLSRGLRNEERIVGDAIEQMLREWGCDPVTVGINIHVPEAQVLSAIDYHIQNSTGLIAIATPRYRDSREVSHTLDWLNSESAIAYAKRKPILILKDKTVNSSGLLSYLGPQRLLEYDPMDLYDLNAKLSVIMPRFRAAIEQKNTENFYQTLGDLVVKGFAAFGVLALIGVIGSFIDE
jgi:hypothetical protein